MFRAYPYTLPEYDPVDHEEHRDWKALLTISLGELIENGYVDFSRSEYDFDAYDEEQRERFWSKFSERFWFRDISQLPPERWRRRLIAYLNEIMPKFKMIYAALEAGANPYNVSDEYHKRRTIYSDFPQSRLSGDEDYAHDGTDLEYETILEGDFIDRTLKIARDYDDVDVLLLNACERMFSQIYSTHVNGL